MIEDGELSMKINDVFEDNKFFLFRKFCLKQGLTTVEDLANFDFDVLYDVKGLGKGKIESIKDRYASLISGEYGQAENCKSGIKKSERFGHILSEYDDVEVSLLNLYGLSERTSKRLIEKGFRTFGDIKKAEAAELNSVLGYNNICRFEELTHIFELSIRENFFNYIQEQKDSREIQIAIRRIHGECLQKIGEAYDISRERIRQVESKLIERFDSIIPYLIRDLLGRKYFEGIDLVEILGDNLGTDVVIFWLKNKETVCEYLDFADVYVVAPKFNVEETITELIKDFVGEGIDLYDNLECFEDLMQENGFEYIDEGMLLNLLEKNNYSIYGSYAVPHKCRYGKLCEMEIERAFPKGIKLFDEDEEDLSKLRELVAKRFGNVELPENTRAISCALSRYLVLCDRGKYIAQKNIEVDTKVIDEIKEYIDGNSRKEVPYQELFESFKDKLAASGNVNNSDFLHGVLMMLYPEDYQYSNKDYLTKLGDQYKSISISERIKSVIRSKNMPVPRKELCKQLLGLSETTVNSVACQDADIILAGQNTFFLITEMNISEEWLSKVRDIIDEIIDKNLGICNAMMLYQELEFNNPNLLDCLICPNYSILYSVIEKKFQDIYDFRRPHIVKKGLLGEVSTSSIIMYIMNNPDVLNYHEYEEIGKSLSWSSSSISSTFNEIVEGCIKVDADTFVREKVINISDDNLDLIRKIIESNLKDGVCPIASFKDWESLPNIGYEWNVFLLKDIVSKYIDTLHIVEQRIIDRRYEKGIIVGNELSIHDFVDAIIYMMKDRGVYEMSEDCMYKFLKDSGVIIKMIPKELYMSEKLQFKNETFFIA